MAHVRLLSNWARVGRTLTSKWILPAMCQQLRPVPIYCTQVNTKQFSYSAHRYGIVKSKFPDVSIPTDMTLPDYLMSKFDEYGDQVALVEGLSNKSYTYKELKDLVRRCASGLTRAGFKQGDVCALYKPNSPEYFLSFYAVASIGGIVTSVNPTYTVDELGYQLDHSGAKWLVTIPESADKAIEAAKRDPHMKGIYVVGDECVDGCRPFSELMNDDGSAFPTDVKINPKEDIVVLPYSSGTTGLPKGVMLTHYNLISNIEQMTVPGLLKMESGVDVVLAVLPFFHIYGMVVVMGNGLKEGSKMVTLPKFEPELFLQTIQDHKITKGFLVPPLVLFLAKHPMVDNYDLSSLKDIMSAAAPLGAGTVHNAKKRLATSSGEELVIRQGYGLTESSPVVLLCSLHDEFHTASAGLLLPNTEGKVIDLETGETLGVGEDGELCFRGPQIMKGYLKNEKATIEMVKDDGWLHTGDIGHYDDTEHFFVIDRCKELIKYKGYQVAPAELEELLLTNPDVQDVAVIGLPDEEAGELPKAFVVPKSDNLTSEDVIKFVEGKVASYKKLRGGVEFLDEIPKSASGKILRRMLRSKELEKMDRT